MRKITILKLKLSLLLYNVVENLGHVYMYVCPYGHCSGLGNTCTVHVFMYVMCTWGNFKFMYYLSLGFIFPCFVFSEKTLQYEHEGSGHCRGG